MKGKNKGNYTQKRKKMGTLQQAKQQHWDTYTTRNFSRFTNNNQYRSKVH